MLRSLTIVMALVAAIGTTPARGLTVVPATFEELVRESVAVVHGRVRAVHGRWTSDRRTIESAVTIDVVDAFKGADTDVATFVVPGGEAGGRILVVPGAPTFRPGDEVVVFLRGTAPALPQPIGLSLGVYRVVPAAAGATKTVVPSPIHAAAGDGMVRRGSASRGPRPLKSFGDDVRALGVAR
jgi:hypothetical protein